MKAGRGDPVFLFRTLRLALLLSVSVPFLAGPLDAAQRREEVRSVSFAGNLSVAAEELQRSIVTRASSCPLLLRFTTCLLGIDWGRDPVDFSPMSLQDDRDRLRFLYWLKGFWSANVEAEVERGPDGVDVVFVVEEGRPYRIGSITIGGDTLPEGAPGAITDAVLRRLPIQAGDFLDEIRMREAQSLLRSHLQSAGYASTEIFRSYSRFDPEDTASVRYEIARGPLVRVGEITVRGADRLDAKTILGRLPFAPGDTLRPSALAAGRRRLQELPIVAVAVIGPDTLHSARDSTIPLVVEVQEGPPRRIRIGGGFNNADCLNLEAEWEHRDLLGGVRSLSLQGRLSNLFANRLQPTPFCSQAGTGEYGRANVFAGLDFLQPTLLSPRVALRARLFAERHSLRNVAVRDALGAEIGVSWSVGRRGLAGIRYQPQLDRLQAAEVTLCATFVACVPEDIQALTSASWLASIGASFSWDATDSLVAASSGARGTLDVEAARAEWGSAYNYLRVFGDASAYVRAGASSVLAFRARAGRVLPGAFTGRTLSVSRKIVPPRKRFYAGGAHSVRGFPQGLLGPGSLSVGVTDLLRRDEQGEVVCAPTEIVDRSCDASPLRAGQAFELRPTGGLALLEAGVELRFPLGEGPWEGVAFADAGQVWPESFAARELEITPGVGLRYNTLFGPLRVDLAYAFERARDFQVVTSNIREFRPGQDAESDRINRAREGDSPELLDWVIDDHLAVLTPLARYGEDRSFALSRFQLHVSLGHAF